MFYAMLLLRHLYARLDLFCFDLLIILPALVVDDVVNDSDWDSVLIYIVLPSEIQKKGMICWNSFTIRM